jgi:asparagine synthase (glutamine-hydrolysing)
MDAGRCARPEDIQRMLTALIHRGPDDHGIHCEASVALGHRRLSIVDLSDQARQPLSNESGDLWLICNGEIYNHQELRKSLLSRGHKFRSGSDSEVILHLYEDFGERAISMLRGMFAFALWDCKTETLLLGRDRLGQKPLFYREQEDAFYFASEALPLHLETKEPLRLDKVALQQYLTFGYIPAPLCAFEGSRKLPPAHYLVKKRGQKALLKRYWSLPYTPKYDDRSPVKRGALEEEFCDLLEESVRLRRMSDVPLGAFLSGGVDSSALVSFLGDAGTKTFSIGFSQRDYDERRYARLVAQRYRTAHYEQVVKPDAVHVLHTLIGQFGEPFADSSAIPCYYLAQMAREQVTVALSGDGADELLGGYMQFVANELAQDFDRLPRFLRESVIGPLVRALPRRLGRDDPILRLKRFMRGVLDGDRGRRPLIWSQIMDSSQRAAILNGDLAMELEELDPLAPALAHGAGFSGSDADRALHMALSSYLPGDLLRKVDITSMAHGLEVRAPFLDHKLVEFIARLPVRQKVHRGQTKKLLKRALHGRLPRELLYRPKKGFAVPLDTWFRGPLRSFLRETILSKRALNRGLFRAESLKILVREHETKQANHAQRLWALLSLELWFQICEQTLPNFQSSL